MATTERPAAHAVGASDIATALDGAEFLHVVARADGDALAAASLLASACERIQIPYHVRFARTEAEAETQVENVDETATALTLGLSQPDPVSLAAFHAVSDLGVSSEPTLAVAGATAGGTVPSTLDDRLLGRAGLERRPGLVVPTDDPAEGLAFTTRAYAHFSGDLDAAVQAVEALEDLSDRSLASLLAIAAVTPSGTPARAGVAVERAIRPYAGGPFGTAGGFADVLDALAREAPGLGIGLSMDADAYDEALSIWRDRSERVHKAVRDAGTARYDGLVVARVDGPVEPVARLLRDFRSPEPVVVTVNDGAAGVAALEASIGGPLATAAEAAAGSALSRGTHGYAQFDADREEAFIEAFRGALA